MKPTPILAWVNCYGAWDPQMRHPVETIGYDHYLETVAKALAALKDRVSVVYVSGGLTDAKGRTECATTIPELVRRLKQKGAGNIVTKADEASFTSITIARTFLTTWQDQHQDATPLLFCDQVRYQTNAYTLAYFAGKFGYFMPPINELLIPIPRLDTHPNSTLEKQAEKLKLMKETGVEELERTEIAARQGKEQPKAS
jgi:hypothetical protein